jgi:hypothetical protein
MSQNLLSTSGNSLIVHVRFFRENAARHFQNITLSKTSTWDDNQTANVTRRYDEQRIINFGDFNIDGTDDIAICDRNERRVRDAVVSELSLFAVTPSFRLQPSNHAH